MRFSIGLFCILAVAFTTMTGARADTVLGSIKPAFYVLVDEADSTNTSVTMTTGIANEFIKALAPLGPGAPMVLSKPLWHTGELTEQCANDPEAVGGVVVTYSAGAASHFFLLYQEETTSFIVSAAMISCNRTVAGKAAPMIVGAVNELPGARGTPWVVRRSQVSVPLLSLAGILSVAAKGKTGSSSSTTNVTLAAVLAAIFTQATSRDIPGYSTPLKLRYGSQHIGVDLIRAMRDLCANHTDLGPTIDATPRDGLCNQLGFSLNPADVAKQQAELDAFEARERKGLPPEPVTHPTP